MAAPHSTNGERMERGIQLFRVAGIRIVIDYSWFAIFLLVLFSLSVGYFPQEHPDESGVTYWIAGLAATLLFFLSILLHELAHSLMAIRSGISIPSITLFVFGGVSKLSEEAKDPGTELKIAIVGPLTSFFLALLFWAMSRLVEPVALPLVVSTLDYLALINGALGVFNLIPGFPLDGGRVLRAIWWRRTGSLQAATRLVSDLGKGFALALMLLGAVQIFFHNLLGGAWLLFIGMFLRGVAERGYQDMMLRGALEGVQVSDVMVRDVVTVSPRTSLRDLVNDYFLRYGYHGFPVLEQNRAVGLVSISSLAGVREEELAEKTVAAVMTPLDDSRIIAADAPLIEALTRMAPSGVGRLVVMVGQNMVGLITRTGLARLVEIRRQLNR
ncbi:MAG TPA: site-2 protease family protein [Vicinamibacteria bacterium]|nr:site-2 protease family protein [Vicinamibacteria bacterium]